MAPTSDPDAPDPDAPDPDATRTVEQMLAVDADQRDDAWLRAFHAVVADAPLVSGDPQLIQGPDGFGYFALRIPPPGAITEPFTVRHVERPCTEGGFGCVILDRSGETAWVFRYGEMWSLRAEGRFDARPPDDDEWATQVLDEEEVLVAAPDEAVLPPWARQVLRNAVGHLDVDEPRVALVVRPAGRPEHSLVLGPLGHVPAEQRHHLTWYLPRHLGLIYGDDDRWAEASVPL